MSVKKLKYNGNEYSGEIVVGAGGLDMTHAMVGETLSVDTLAVPVVTEDFPVRLVGADQGENGFIHTLDEEVLCIADASSPPEFEKNGVGEFYFSEDMIGAYYCEEMRQAGQYEHIIRFHSGIRLFDRSDHPGGLYTGETAGEVIADIIGDIVPYAIDEDIAQIPIYNYLPYARRRNNLQLVLMATGAAIKNNPDGSLRITQLSDATAGVFDESRVFIGGEVTDKTPATAVQVTEHNYLPTEDEIELFNDSTISIETVRFKEPIHDLQITGGIILSSGVNYCTFQGTGAVVLTGKRYTHVTRVITVGTPPTGIDSDVVKRVVDNTLLGPNNAVFVAEKLYDFLSVAKSITQEVVFGTERPADVVKVLHPYSREMVDACIKSMQISFGKTELRAVCEFLVGYTPPGATTGFENHVLLDGVGAWTVPAGVTKIRAIIVAPGTQGNPGGKGQNGSTTTPGTGGAAGVGGNGGKILEINLSVAPSDVKNYSCDAEHTVFDGIGAEMGRSYPYGYTEPKTGLVLGKNGRAGIPGGNGMPGGEPVTNPRTGTTYYPGASGSSSSMGGTTAYGGGGGGAATGGSGSGGGNGVVSQTGGYLLHFASWQYTSLSSITGSRSYYFDAATGNVFPSGATVTITPTSSRDTVYVISGKSVTRYRNHDNIGYDLGYIEQSAGTVSGSAITYVAYHGNGGNGALGGNGSDATDYGEGGQAGDGGGGGGASRSAGGQGGDGGSGGNGGPGCIIVYY